VSVRYAMLSTFPPTQCGLATFSSALVAALTAAGTEVGVVSVVDEITGNAPVQVCHQWVRSSIGGAAGAAAALNEHDIAIIQHEYGIFAGRDGEDVLEVLRALWIPAVAVLHTVLVTPTAHQRAILEEIVHRCETIVTMTNTARDRLIQYYEVDRRKVVVIPHGAADTRPTPGAASRIVGSDPRAGIRPTVLTWGLLGPGKGIEWALEALALLGDLTVAPEYHIVGSTHPRVHEAFGEQYRDGLIGLADSLRLQGCVRFDNRYLTQPALNALVRDADIVLLPYDSREQVTSGVLIEAIAAGKPVISTEFPHAVELLSSGAGLLVPRQDPAALASALRRVLTEPGLAASMSAEARRLAPDLLWSAVAARYQATLLAALPSDGALAIA
jgi:polysaccharide biosynthesis protein PslF